MKHPFTFKDIEKINSYIGEYNWSKIDIAIVLAKFSDTHGKTAVQNLLNFIACWEEYAQLTRFPDLNRTVCSTVSHDLGIAEDNLAVPRSGSYTKAYVDRFLGTMRDVKKENDKIRRCPAKDLPLLIPNLKFGTSKKIAEERMKT